MDETNVTTLINSDDNLLLTKKVFLLGSTSRIACQDKSVARTDVRCRISKINSPYCLQHISCNASSENLMVITKSISSLMIFFSLITFSLETVLKFDLDHLKTLLFLLEA